MAKEFLTLKRQTVVDIANAIRSKTNSDKAIKIEDLDDAIGEIESGGGGSAMLERPGNQPVPREGYIKKIKFNTDLSVDEVISILEKLEYYEYDGYDILMEADLYGEGVGYNYGFYILRNNNNGLLNYTIAGYNYGQNTDDYFDGDIFVTDYENAIDIDGNQWTSCWSPDWKEEYGEINCEVAASYPDWDDPTIIREIGLQNDLLVDLICIPGEPISKELTGTYSAIDLEITENGTIDVLEMIDNKEIPISIEINIPTPEIKGDLKDIIPNEGYIERVKLNTSLSSEEVDLILSKLEYGVANHSIEQMDGVYDTNNNYFIAWGDDDNYNLIKGVMVKSYDTSYEISEISWDFNEFKMVKNVLYISEYGWNPAFNGEIEINGTLRTNDYTSDYKKYPLGNQNDIIISLAYIPKGESINKELKGTYRPTELEITENSTVDILPMIDNKEIPVSIEVSVKGRVEIKSGGVVVPNNGELITDVYFNTNLSTEKVLEIIEPLQNHYDENNEYVLLASNTDYTWGRIYYNGNIVLQHGSSWYTLFDSFNGWADTDKKWGSMFGHSIGHIVLHKDNIGSNYFAAGSPVGDQNNQLLDLFSLTPSFGTPQSVTISEGVYYDCSSVAITENSEIDIAAMIDENRLPFKIEVNVPQPPVYDGSVTITDVKDDE